MALAVALLGAAPAAAGRPGGAFLDTGLGARGPGLGGALTAVADGPAAVLYNPAGLSASTGRGLLASYLPLSLERTQTGLAAAANLRGGLAFGLAWLHAGAGGLLARDGSGQVLGQIGDDQNAVLFAVATALGPGLAVGAGVKLIDHRIDVPQVGASSASGRGLDLGLRLRLGPGTVAGLAVRNLFDRLSWTVLSGADQTRVSDERLGLTLAAGLSHRWREVVLAAADVEILDLDGEPRAGAHGGLEVEVSPLLTLRGGVHGVGQAEGLGLPAFGLTVRPMRAEALQLHYTFASDELDAGGRSVLALSSRF